MRPTINAIDTAALSQTIKDVAADPSKGKMAFEVHTEWAGQFRTESRPAPIVLGGETLERDFLIEADEPEALLGQNSGANPQELLMAALNACMAVGYVSGASMKGITLSRLEIRTKGELDLRGFLGIDPNVKAGYDHLEYEVTIAGDGTPEQFQQIHETVMQLSPNRFNVANPIRLDATLKVEESQVVAA